MQWDGSPQAGFSSAGETWLPLSADFPTRNVAAQLEDPGSMLNLHRALLAYRKRSPELQTGPYERVEAPDGVYAYRRGDGVLVALNFTGDSISFSAPGTVALSTYLDAATPGVLRPHEGLIIEI